MKRCFKILPLAIMSILLAGCFTKPNINNYEKVCKGYQFKQPYDSIAAYGQFNVVLTKKPVGSPICMYGPKSVVQYAHARVRNHQLLLSQFWGSITPPGQVKVLVPVGNMSTLRVDLHKQSNMNAKRMPFDNIIVHTYNTAHADVTARNALLGSASDQSSIYYYGNPKKVSVKTHCPGRVVHLNK